VWLRGLFKLVFKLPRLRSALSSRCPMICVAPVSFQTGLQTSNCHVFGLKSWQADPSSKTSSYSRLNSSLQAAVSSRCRNKFVISKLQHGALSPVSCELQAALSTTLSGSCGTDASLDSMCLHVALCKFAPHSTLPSPRVDDIVFSMVLQRATGGGYRVVHEQGCSLTM
jgi:hypothetical protein